jgi:hypothetical protein
VHQPLGRGAHQHAADGAAVGRADDQQSGVALLGGFVKRAGGARALELDVLDRHALGVEIALELLQRARRPGDQVLLDTPAAAFELRTRADGRDYQRRSGEARGS